MTYLIELILTIWAALSVRAINRNARYGLESGMVCNLCFLTYWLWFGLYGFFIGDLIFTMMYSREIFLEYKLRKLRNGV